MRLIYIQTLRLDEHFCKTSRIELLKHLAQYGHEITLVVGYKREQPELEVPFRICLIPSIRIPVLRQLSFNVLAHVWVFSALLRGRCDAVIVDPYTFHCGFPFDILAYLGWIKAKFVMDVRSAIFHPRPQPVRDRLRRALMRIAFRYARSLFAGFTTVSKLLREFLIRDHGLPESRIMVWESGVNLSDFTPGAKPTEIKELNNKFVVMYHGTFGTDRGLPEAVQAMDLLRNRYSDIVLLLLGTGNEEAKLRCIVRYRGLKNVIILDPVNREKVPVYLALCHVGIMPFALTDVMRSSSPLKLFEYLAMGKPVIVTKIEAFQQVLNSHECAIYLKSNEPDEIARGIIYAYEQREQLTGWGEIGRKIVIDHFGWEQQAMKVHNFLKALDHSVK